MPLDRPPYSEPPESSPPAAATPLPPVPVPGSGRRQLLVTILAATVLVAACAAGGFAVFYRFDRPGPGDAAPLATESGAAPQGTTSADPAAPGNCAYRSTDAPGQRIVPEPPATPRHTGQVRTRVWTNLGLLVLDLDADKAPCAVNAVANLAQERYYSNTECHRLTTAELWIVQCGDPTGQGNGTPGYEYDSENLPPAGSPWTYPRGTVAMANAGPNTNSAQFFIVYRDSRLGPDYPIVGQVSEGLELLDTVAAAGTEDSRPDGRPRRQVLITAVTVG